MPIRIDEYTWRRLKTGTPVPHRERELAATQPSPVVVYHWSREQIEQYMRERYGDRLDASAVAEKSERVYTTRENRRQRKEDTTVTVETTEATAPTKTVTTDKEAKPMQPRKPRPEVTREQYLELRLRGVSRVQAMKQLFRSITGAYSALERWGLKDKDAEAAELARLRGEPAAPAAAPKPEPAATSEPQPTITVPVPVGIDMMRAVLQATIADVHATAQSKGWHDEPVPLPVHLALIHSEVSEALEADRKGFGTEKVAEELADVVIRVMDTAAAHGLDLAGALISKMARNKAREYRHGGLKY